MDAQQEAGNDAYNGHRDRKPNSELARKQNGARGLILGLVLGTVIRVGYEVLMNEQPFNAFSVVTAVMAAVVALGLWKGLLEQFEDAPVGLKFFIGLALGFGSQSLPSLT